MLTLAVYLSSFFLQFLISMAGDESPPYRPTDNILLDCGSSISKMSPDGRTWQGDQGSKFSGTSDVQNSSSSSNAFRQDPSVEQVPYMTARIFNSSFTYSFPVSSGPKFVRFYFYPTAYSGHNESEFFFSVTSGVYTLLSNFSASLTVAPMGSGVSSLVKEFSINVWDNQILNITFSPSPNSWPSLMQFEMDNYTALETVYRLNVGGNHIPAEADSGMFRSWSQDDSYIYGGNLGLTPNLDSLIQYTQTTPPYIAPRTVYTTSRTMTKQEEINKRTNLTWLFHVDSGFYYLVRLHFCELQLEVTRPGERVFSIFLNNQTAEEEMDVIVRSGGTGYPIYQDYVVLLLSDGSRRKQELWLDLHPNADSKYANVILNGLEMFKLNNSNGSLAGLNPDPVLNPPPSEQHPNSPVKPNNRAPLVLITVIVAAVGGVVALSLLWFLVLRPRMRVKHVGGISRAKSSWVPFSYTTRSTTTNGSSLPADICRHFSLAQIKDATCNFNKNFIIGEGGFGNVYKGFIKGGSTTVAVKRLNPSSKQGAREFETEIRMLSKLRHIHLVSLIGYCDEEGEMILVYDYMARGTLRAKHTIIHRDVKSTNILLDEKWVAKVSDFGLSRVGPTSMTQTHVSTAVKGSFGVMRKAGGDPRAPKEQVSVAEWGRRSYRNGALDRIMDQNLRDEVAPECLKKFGEIADSCVRNEGIERPPMSDVVWALEFALQLQETAERNAQINSGDEVYMGRVGVKPDGSQPSSSAVTRGGATTSDNDDLFSVQGQGVPSHLGDGEISLVRSCSWIPRQRRPGQEKASESRRRVE
ncbi:Receptor-like protein kinase FERONIA [Vitis vinifera]|uniref:Receptor-like protein kinase FERONIA n=1 Tax=Vitis vinifera TaxID=29760 RepID=A0A438IMP2_VITVI|nr:Receptor-like protein kinase FERONIA [Vitis vinifera]